MTDAWFSVETAPFFSFVSLLAALAVLEVWAKQGRYRALVENIWNACLVLAAGFLATAAVAWQGHQPTYVTMTLAFVGAVTGAASLGTRRQMRGWYREAELRRTIAADL